MTAQATEMRQTSRTDWVWLLLPYLLLPVCSLWAALSGGISAGEVPRAVVAAVVLIGWHTYWTLAHRHWLERALLPMAVYYLGMLAVGAVLLQVSISYLPFYLSSYALAFVALPGTWAYVGLALATVVPLALPGPLSVTGPNMAITVGGVSLAAVIGWSIRRLEAETAARKAALVELADAHADLKRALAENLDLQDRLVAEARESGVAAERARIAADIHDTLAAALTGIVSQLEAVDAQAPPEQRLRTRVQLCLKLARDALGEARQSIQALRPTVLTGHGLPGALETLVSDLDRADDLHASFHLSGTQTPVLERVEDTLVQITRESLTNIRRHAQATQVHLTLTYLGEQIALDIADNGVGFDRAQLPQGSHGLDLMAERAANHGGTVDIQTQPGSGTVLTATLPITAQARDRDD